MVDKYMHDKLRKWRTSLAGLRWHAVANFVQELLEVRDPLRIKFNLQVFSSQLPKNRLSEVAEGKGDQGNKTFQLADTAIHSNFFWAMCEVVLAVGMAPETLSRWSESCFYHGPDGCAEGSCPFKSARAAEMGAGAAEHLLAHCKSKAGHVMTQVAPTVSPEECNILSNCFHTAWSKLQTEWEFHFTFWQKLPWKLCGVAVGDLVIGRVVAQQCIIAFERLSHTQKRNAHPLTRRFLDPCWAGQASYANHPKSHSVVTFL